MIFILFVLCTVLGWAASSSPGCFQERPPGEPRANPTVFVDCMEPIKSLVEYDKAHAPTLFSRKPGVGYRLPVHWIHRSCVLHVSIPEDGEDRVSFFEIAQEAGVINAACVARPPHLGGTTRVGPKQIMNVSILGVPRRSFPPPRPHAIPDDTL
ncbi:MAG: hypothetical protein Q9211_004165 [Gyalolechia sp. 1 TL-2023]